MFSTAPCALACCRHQARHSCCPNPPGARLRLNSTPRLPDDHTLLCRALGARPLLFARSRARNDTPLSGSELNAIQPADAGCRVTFLATNHLGGQLDRAAVEL